jgi:hypothetical protein
MLSVLAERAVSFVLPHQEILTSQPAEKDPNHIITVHVASHPDVGLLADRISTAFIKQKSYQMCSIRFLL